MDKLISLDDILFNLYEKNYKNIITPTTEKLIDDFYKKYIYTIKDFQEQNDRSDEINNLTWAHLEDGFRAGFKTALNLIFDSPNQKTE